MLGALLAAFAMPSAHSRLIPREMKHKAGRRPSSTAAFLLQAGEVASDAAVLSDR
jgi:hypothetical protein